MKHLLLLLLVSNPILASDLLLIENLSHVSHGTTATISTTSVKLNGTSCTVTGTPEQPPLSKTCVNGPKVRCMGALSEWPGGTLLWQSLPPKETQIWHVDYDTAANADGSFMLFDGWLKTYSLSEYANDFTLEYPCQITQESPQQPLSYADSAVAEWYQCSFKNNTRYFLNIKSTVSVEDPYSITVR